jgi:hypothetical protein
MPIIRPARRCFFAVCFPTAFLLAQAAPNPATTAPVPSAAAAAEEAVVLSPFQVSADSEQGYLATQTLNGTRLKTDLKDVGTSLTVFTDQMLEALGANSSYQRRHFYTLGFTPFKQTTIRVNFERGHIQQPGNRPWPDYDAVSPWLAAGSPLINTFVNTTTGKPAGTQNFAYAGLVSTQYSAGGTPIPTQKLQNQGQSVPTSFANGFPVNGGSFRSLVNESIYPTFASAFGNSAYRLTDYRTGSVFLEQQITRDLFIEAAINTVDSKLRAINGFVGQLCYIYVDPNKQLPNGQPNPNAGMLYSQSQPTIIDSLSTAKNVRAMASYQFDFAQHAKSWLRYLGRHQAAVFVEEDDGSSWSSNNGLNNTTPLSNVGAAANITNAANGIQYRYYYDRSSC